MYRKILVGYDDSDQSKDALALAKQLADALGSKLVVAGVFHYDPRWDGLDHHLRDGEEDFAHRLLAAAESVGAEASSVPSTSPARGLHEFAERIGADLILVGSASHGRAGQVLAGNTGVALLHGSPCAVAIAPKGYRDSPDTAFSTIAVGVDDSPESLQALAAASELASCTNSTLKLVTVSQPPPLALTAKGGNAGWHELKEAIDEQMRGRLEEATGLVPEGIDAQATFISGDPVEALLNVAETTGTVLVVGSRAYGPLRRVLLGSVSTALVRSATSPLLVTPRGIQAEAGAPAAGRR